VPGVEAHLFEIRAGCAALRASGALRAWMAFRNGAAARPAQILSPTRSKKGRPSDIAVILYTSAPPANPKGVSQTHAAMTKRHGARRLRGFAEDDDILCYLPMAWVGDFLYSYAQVHIAGSA